MPTTKIAHEPWCGQHLSNGDTCGQGEACTFDLPTFGALMPNDDTERRGSLFVDQFEGDDGLRAHLEFYPAPTGAMDLDALRSLRVALRDDPAALLAAVEMALKILGEDA